MNFKSLVGGLALAVLATASVQAADTFVIDGTHSTVGFKVTHLMVSKVRGHFDTFEGAIQLDPADTTKSSVEVSIDVASINTGNDDRDNHLRAPDFFDAEKYPKITFKSTSIEKTGDTSYIATGDLTIRDTTRKVALPFEMSGPVTDPWGNTRIGIEIEPVTIDRQDYGVSWSKAMDAGGVVVSDDVTLDLAAEAVQQKAATAG